MVGALPKGLPLPSFGGVDWGDVLQLIGPAAGIALIAFADTGVLSRTFAARRGEDVNGSTEMKAIGAANVASGLFGGFPISASGSRTPWPNRAGRTPSWRGWSGRWRCWRSSWSRPGSLLTCPTPAGRGGDRRRDGADRCEGHGAAVADEPGGGRSRRRRLPRGRARRRPAGHPGGNRTVVRRGRRPRLAAVPEPNWWSCRRRRATTTSRGTPTGTASPDWS